MADTEQTNAEANQPRTEDVLSAVPMPNRATRRKMEALGEAVPVPPLSAPSEPALLDSANAEAGAPNGQAADAIGQASLEGTKGDAPKVEKTTSDTPSSKPLGVRKPPLAAAVQAKRSPAKSAPAKMTAAKIPAAKPEVVTPTAIKPTSSAMQADAPASHNREPALSDEGPAPVLTKTHSPIQAGFPAFSIKDMTMDMSTNFSGFQTAMTEAQAKAKAAFEKSSNAMGEAGEFAKGNVEALIESSKILAEGCQEIGSTLVAESRTAFETMTGDIKELAAAKSPTDFLKIQSDMVRKNFDSAVAYSSKNSEAFLKLMSDAAAPLSGRMSLAVEKARQTTSQTMAAPATV